MAMDNKGENFSMPMLHTCSATTEISGGSRISEIGEWGATPKVGAPTDYLAKLSKKNCMKMMEIRPGGGGRGACLDPLGSATGSICY